MKKEENKVISIENGLEIVKKKKKKGGKMKGAGRKTRAESLTNYARGVKMLDDRFEYALEAMIKGIDSEDPVISFKCAEFIINKCLIAKKGNPGAKDGEMSKEDMDAAINEVMLRIEAK